MRIFFTAFASAMILGAQAASAALICQDFLALESKQQQFFVRGLVDGMSATLGVMDTFSRHLESKAGTPEERTGIQNMHELPKGFLSKSCCLADKIISEKIIKGCQEHKELPVGNMLTDVMSGAL